ncbi:MAG: MASE1 domain-containing protein [Nitrospiraceae bacterium]
MLITLAAIYIIAGKLGLTLAFIHQSATVVWPPTGIALAAFLALGYRVWPAIFFGAFVVNITTVGSIATCLGIALGNTLEGLAGAYVVNRFCHGRHAFLQARDILKFAWFAGLLSTSISATVGVTSLSLDGVANWADYGCIWLTWWLGDAAGAFIIAPLLLLWNTEPWARWTWPQFMEALFLVISVVVVGQVVFGGWLPPEKSVPLTYVCIPPVVWAAYRFGRRETAAITFLLSGVAISGTLHGFGPFVRGSQHESLLLLQIFIGLTGVMGLAFSAIVSDRTQVESDRERLIRELQEALENVKTLRGLVPICSWCKNIRNDKGFWDHIETYIQQRSEAQFTHGVCPECLKRFYPEIGSK